MNVPRRETFGILSAPNVLLLRYATIALTDIAAVLVVNKAQGLGCFSFHFCTAHNRHETGPIFFLLKQQRNLDGVMNETQVFSEPWSLPPSELTIELGGGDHVGYDNIGSNGITSKTIFLGIRRDKVMRNQKDARRIVGPLRRSQQLFENRPSPSPFRSWVSGAGNKVLGQRPSMR